jgi:hypothetical protein
MEYIENMILSIGAMKAGTSWLAAQVGLHPEVFVPPIKEIHYFSHINSGIKLLDNNARIESLKMFALWQNEKSNFSHIRSALNWFESYFGDDIDDNWFVRLTKMREGKAFFWAASNLLATLELSGWKHVLSLCSEPKAIYILRDPLARLWSHVRFQAAIDQKLELLSKWNTDDYNEFINSTDMLSHSSYSKTIEVLFSSIKQENVLILYFEEMMDLPIDHLRIIESFLGVEKHNYEDFAFRNPAAQIAAQKAFVDCAKDFISAEFARLDGLGIRIPKTWVRFHSIPGSHF